MKILRFVAQVHQMAFLVTQVGLYECTMDQELQTKLLACRERTLMHKRLDAAGGCFVSIQQMAALFRWNDVMAAILKVWRQIEKPTPSVDAHLTEEQRYQISSRSHLKQQSLGLFEEVTTKTRRWVAIWDQFLVQKHQRIPWTWKWTS